MLSYMRCHCTRDAITHAIPSHMRYHCTWDAITHAMPLHARCLYPHPQAFDPFIPQELCHHAADPGATPCAQPRARGKNPILLTPSTPLPPFSPPGKLFIPASSLFPPLASAPPPRADSYPIPEGMNWALGAPQRVLKTNPNNLRLGCILPVVQQHRCLPGVGRTSFALGNRLVRAWKSLFLPRGR